MTTKTITVTAAEIQRDDKIIEKGRENRSRSFKVQGVVVGNDGRVSLVVSDRHGSSVRSVPADCQVTVRRVR